MKVAVSYLKSNNYPECIEKINQSDAAYLHVDMCDGRYVRNKNFEIDKLIPLLETSRKPLDIHLMCKDASKYASLFTAFNVRMITFHPLAVNDVYETISKFKSYKYKVGLAINPSEKVSLIKPYLPYIDHVLVMSVTPGKGGQKFNTKILKKFAELKVLKEKYHFTISVDGGINDETITFLKDKNIDYVVSGSYITDSDDYNRQIHNLS